MHKDKLFLQIPGCEVGFELRQLTAVEGGLADAAALLAAVVVEQTEGVASQEDDSHKVAGRKQSHAEVAETPYELERRKGAKEHHEASGTDAIEGYHPCVVGNEPDVGLAVIVVADDAGEGEQENGDGHEDGTGGTDLGLHIPEGDTTLGAHLDDGLMHTEFYMDEASLAEIMISLCDLTLDEFSDWDDLETETEVW